MRISFTVLTILIISVTQSNFAQELKQITLSEAVLEQRKTLGPDNVRGLQWLDADRYMYLAEVDGKDQLKTFSMKENAKELLFKLEDLNKKLEKQGVELKRMPNFMVRGSQLIFNTNKGHQLMKLKDQSIEPFNHTVEGASDFSFSEDGQAVAYVVDNNVRLKMLGSDEIEVTKDGNEHLIYGKAVSRFEFGISKGLFWSPDAKAIAYYRNDASEVTSYPLTNYTTLPAERAPIKYPMAGGKSEKVSLQVYHVGSKETVTLETGVGEEYICSINWTPNGEYIVLVTLNRDQNHAKYKLYKSSDGTFEGDLYEEKDDKYVEPLHALIFPDNNPRKFIYFSQKDGFMHLYMKEKDEEVQLTKGSWVLTDFLGFNRKSGLIYVSGTGENPAESHVFKVDIGRPEFQQISSRKGQHRAVVNEDQTYIIDYFSSVETPRMINIADANGNVVKQVLNAPDPLQEYAISRPEIFTIKNEEGQDLVARMIKPHNFDDSKKYPVLVYVYNGPHAQLITDSWWAGAPMWMNYFAEKGYLVFTVDGRGSYNRGKAFEQSIFRNVSHVEMKDQLAGVKYLKSLPYVDQDKMAVHGWSYGGFMTTSLMLKHPDVFKVGVAGGPVTNWAFYEIMYTERYMDDPVSNPEGFKNTDLTNFVGGLKGDLLLIHGMSDDVVVPQHNFTLLKKFVDEGIQVDFFPYVGHPHNVRGKDRVHLMEKVLTYIEEHL